VTLDRPTYLMTSLLRKPKYMTPFERKIAAMEKGVSLSEGARQLGLSAGHVAAVVRGERRMDLVEGWFAKALGRPHCEVFPPLPTPRKKRRVA